MKFIYDLGHSFNTISMWNTGFYN